MKLTCVMGSRQVSLVLILLMYCIENVWSLELIPTILPSRLYPSKGYVTVSGTEIGGVMAQMMHFSHSKYIKGCAVYSSTFYRCGPANGNTEDFKLLCTKDSPLSADDQYPVDDAVSDLLSYQTNHLIDELKYIRNSYLYVYCGLQNEGFRADQQLDVIALYEHYLGSPYLIKARVQDTSEQLRVIYPRDRYQSACPSIPETDGTLSKNCTNLSAPAEALGFLLDKYISFTNPFYPSYRYIHLEPLKSFDQTEFIVGLENTGLDDVGYYYVPKQCQARLYSYGSKYGKPCLVHIYFHSCGQGREFQGTAHVVYSNYLEIAEMNNIIMLFPQVLSSESNPGGCWDFVGWGGPSYATKTGPQIQAVWAMIERLLYLPKENPQPYSPTPYPTPTLYPSPPPSSSPIYYRAKETASARAYSSSSSSTDNKNNYNYGSSNSNRGTYSSGTPAPSPTTSYRPSPSPSYSYNPKDTMKSKDAYSKPGGNVKRCSALTGTCDKSPF